MGYLDHNGLSWLWRKITARLSEKADGNHSHKPEELGAAAQDLSNVEMCGVFRYSTMPAAPWTGIAYGNGRFVAVSAGSAGAYSDDGLTWTATTLPADAFWTGLAYGNGRFLAVTADTNMAAYSEDGVAWTAASLPAGDWFDLAYGNGKFVTVAMQGGIAAYSEDGVTWAVASLPPAEIWGNIAYGGGKFVALSDLSGSVAYSEDGITWASTALLPEDGHSYFWGGLAYGNGRFVAVASGTDIAVYSEDGATWTTATLPKVDDWAGLAYGDGLFVAISNRGKKTTGNAAVSTDGINWTVGYLEASEDWSDIAFGGGRFVAVGRETQAAYSIKGSFVEMLPYIHTHAYDAVTDKPASYPPAPHTHTKEEVGLERVQNVATNDQVPTFTQAEVRANLVSGETLSTLLGKVVKWFADLGALAFKSTAAKSDLASDVQASLGKADTALQSFTETDPTVPAWAKAANKPSYPYSEIKEKPTAFTPAAHKASHRVGGEDALTPADIGAAEKSKSVSVTLTAAGWSGSAPYTQTVSVAGLGASSNGSIGLPPSTTAAQREAARKAIIGVSAQAAGSITVVADGIKPAVDIPAQVIILG